MINIIIIFLINEKIEEKKVYCTSTTTYILLTTTRFFSICSTSKTWFILMYRFDNIIIKIRIHFFVVGFGTSKSIHTGLFSSTHTPKPSGTQDTTHKTYFARQSNKRWEGSPVKCEIIGYLTPITLHT